MTFTAVGSLQNGENSVSGTSTTFSLTTTTVGDYVMAEICANNHPATGVTSTKCTWTQAGTTVGPLTSNGFGTFYNNVWFGKVNSTGSDTVTVTFGTAPGGNVRFDAHEFHASSGNMYFDVQGTLNSAGTPDWPTLTPAGSGELYFGWSENASSAVAGSTSGFVYQSDSNGNGEGYCLSVSAAYTPVWGDSSQVAGLMVLMTEVSSSVTANAGLAAGTGTAQSPAPDVIPAAGPATGTGTAQAPSATITPAAGLAAATGAAQPPVPDVTAGAGLATGTASALAPVPVVIADAGLAAGTGTAQSPVPDVIPVAVLATGSGTAQQPAATVTASSGLATATGTALAPVPVVIVSAGLATGTGAALQPTVNTSGNTTANAGLATASGAALQPAPLVQPAAGLATATGSAQQPVAVVQVTAGLAAAAGTAQQPALVLASVAMAGLAAGSGTALNPSVSGPVPPATVVFAYGTPCFEWETGDPYFEWATGDPYLS